MDSTKDALNLIQELDDPIVTKDVAESKKYSHIVHMQMDLLNFVMDRLSLIREEESFRNRIKSAILDKIETDEVSVPQLISLLKNTNTDSTIAADSVFSLMRPNKDGAVSPLVDPKQNSETDDTVDFGKSLSPEESEAMHTLMRILQKTEGYKKDSDLVDDGR